MGSGVTLHPGMPEGMSHLWVRMMRSIDKGLTSLARLEQPRTAVLQTVEKLGRSLGPTISIPGGACIWDWQGAPVARLPRRLAPPSDERRPSAGTTHSPV